MQYIKLVEGQLREPVSVRSTYDVNVPVRVVRECMCVVT